MTTAELVFDHITNNTFDIACDSIFSYRVCGDNSIMRVKELEYDSKNNKLIPGKIIAELHAPQGYHFSRNHAINFAKAVICDRDYCLESITGWDL